MTTGGLIAQPEPWHKGSRRDSSADGITECLRAPKPDLRLWRGPGPRTTVAGAVGRMAMRWGRMKAIVQDRYGSADVLDFRDVARPEVGPGDVLVKVVAAGVDLGAWHLMTGQPYLMRILG